MNEDQERERIKRLPLQIWFAYYQIENYHKSLIIIITDLSKKLFV
jgi:hypothetical protein